MTAVEVLDKIDADFVAESSEEFRRSSLSFFKEDIEVRGIKTASVKKISAKYWRELCTMNKSEIFDVCEKLFERRFLEDCQIAADISFRLKNEFVPEDFHIFEKWVNQYITNWAVCDTFCTHTMGSFLLEYPQYMRDIELWRVSSNRWVRRASAVTLILPVRKGFLFKEVIETADALLVDEDDMVRKGYGWMLKVASANYDKEVFEYVMSKKNIMPRTALRYAIEKMSPQMRSEAMSK